MSVLYNDSGSVRVGVLMPEEVPNLVLKWDPYYTAYSNGNTVTTWNDTVSSKVLTAVGAPKFNTDVLNSYPVIDRFGSNVVLTNSVDINSAVSGDFTCFIIARQKTFTSVVQLLNTYIGSATGTAGAFFRISLHTAGRLGYQEFSQHNVLAFQLTGFPDSVSVPVDQYFVACVNIKRGGDAFLRTTIGKRLRASTNVPAFINPAISDVDFGGGRTGDSTERKYGGLLIYNRALTEHEETAIFRGLQLKYKI